jgi:hypothetical protein
MFVRNLADEALAEARSGTIPAPESFTGAVQALRHLNKHGTVANSGGALILFRGDGLPTSREHLAILRHWREGIAEILRGGAR